MYEERVESCPVCGSIGIMSFPYKNGVIWVCECGYSSDSLEEVEDDEDE
ncbi:hypothetical protein HY573_02390 [Candidatus Parcubacteria bacterium]|nr:hypothetical protein [Candidatus Parcubacteria bacterium]